MPLEMDPNATRIFQPYKIYGALKLVGGTLANHSPNGFGIKLPIPSPLGLWWDVEVSNGPFSHIQTCTRLDAQARRHDTAWCSRRCILTVLPLKQLKKRVILVFDTPSQQQ